MNEELIKKISKLKKEPKWVLNYRLKAYEAYVDLDMPLFGPKLDIDFESFNYYKKIEEMSHNWEELPEHIQNTFKNLGVIDAEKKYLGGISTQYESEVIYHNMLDEVIEKGVIFLSTEEAIKQYPKLYQKYFGQLVNYAENKFTALNSCMFSGGAFIYIPPHTKLDRPLQSYFRIASKNMGQFERTLIIVDEGSELNYIEGCTAIQHGSDSLHAAVVEIFVAKDAKCRYTTIQNWATNVLNLVTKRAITEENATMEWIDGNIGSRITMKYPSVILKGDNSKANCISIAYASNNQNQDAGTKMIHLGKNTKSNILSKSISTNGGKSTFRGEVNISKNALNSKSTCKCDTLILTKDSSGDTIPKNVCSNSSSSIEHEATVSKISQEQLFYISSRGINEEKAKELLVMGFIDKFKDELPMEYAIELNRLIKLNID